MSSAVARAFAPQRATFLEHRPSTLPVLDHPNPRTVDYKDKTTTPPS